VEGWGEILNRKALAQLQCTWPGSFIRTGSFIRSGSFLRRTVTLKGFTFFLSINPIFPGLHSSFFNNHSYHHLLYFITAFPAPISSPNSGRLIRAPHVLHPPWLLLFPPLSAWTWPGSAPLRTGPRPFESWIPSFLSPPQFKTYGFCFVTLFILFIHRSSQCLLCMYMSSSDVRSCSDSRFQQPRFLLQQIGASQARY